MKPLGAAFVTFFRIRDQRRPQRQLSECDCPADRRPIAQSLLETSNESSSIQPSTSSNNVKPGREDDDDGPVRSGSGRLTALAWRRVMPDSVDFASRARRRAGHADRYRLLIPETGLT
jgi:hypothetical protein